MPTPTEIEFLRSLPVDGSMRQLVIEELLMAFRLHTEKLVFIAHASWPITVACITYEGRRVLSKE